MTILAVGTHDQTQLDELVEAAGDHPLEPIANLAAISDRDDTVAALIGVTGTIDPVLDHLPRLRWIHSAAAGVDATLTPRLRASPIELISATGNGAIPLAEHAAMLMLMLNRDAPAGPAPRPSTAGTASPTTSSTARPSASSASATAAPTSPASATPSA